MGSENKVQEQPKKLYSPPQLTVHGNVERITQGTRTGTSDANLTSGDLASLAT